MIIRTINKIASPNHTNEKKPCQSNVWVNMKELERAFKNDDAISVFEEVQIH